MLISIKTAAGASLKSVDSATLTNAKSQYSKITISNKDESFTLYTPIATNDGSIEYRPECIVDKGGYVLSVYSAEPIHDGDKLIDVKYAEIDVSKEKILLAKFFGSTVSNTEVKI